MLTILKQTKGEREMKEYKFTALINYRNGEHSRHHDIPVRQVTVRANDKLQAERKAVKIMDTWKANGQFKSWCNLFRIK